MGQQAGYTSQALVDAEFGPPLNLPAMAIVFPSPVVLEVFSTVGCSSCNVMFGLHTLPHLIPPPEVAASITAFPEAMASAL